MGGSVLLPLLNGSEVAFSACNITHRAEQPLLIPFDEHMLFTNCLVLLLILSKWRHSEFWPDPCDVMHFDVIFPMIHNFEHGQRN